MELLRTLSSTLWGSSAAAGDDGVQYEEGGRAEEVQRSIPVYDASQCLQCSVPCDDHRCPPPSMLKRIDREKRLFGSAKQYWKHVVVCCGGGGAEGPDEEAARWPPNLSNEDGRLQGRHLLLSRLFKRLKKASKEDAAGRKLFCSLSTLPGAHYAAEEDRLDIVVFPDHTAWRGVSSEQVVLLVQAMLAQEHHGSAAEEQPKLTVEGLPEPERWRPDFTLLVCAHAKRDKRCGVIGRQLIEELREEAARRGMDEEQVVVAGVSHVGGHKLAGNVIVYPGGHFYGRLVPAHAPVLFEQHIVQGKVIKEVYRGNHKGLVPKLDW